MSGAAGLKNGQADRRRNFGNVVSHEHRRWPKKGQFNQKKTTFL
jgi:hypothetical protein